MAFQNETLAKCTQNMLYDFTPRKETVNNINLYTDNAPILRVYESKFHGVNRPELNKNHIHVE